VTLVSVASVMSKAYPRSRREGLGKQWRRA
jgi:hypothetical protein